MISMVCVISQQQRTIKFSSSLAIASAKGASKKKDKSMEPKQLLANVLGKAKETNITLVNIHEEVSGLPLKKKSRESLRTPTHLWK